GFFSGSPEAELLSEQAQVLAVSRFRSPKLAGEVAAPNTAIRRKLGDDLAARLVHVAERIELGTAGAEKRQLRVCISVLGQAQHIAKNRVLLGTSFEIEAVVDDHGMAGEVLEHVCERIRVVAIAENVHDDARVDASP